LLQIEDQKPHPIPSVGKTSLADHHFGLGKYQIFSVLEQFRISVQKKICVHFLACNLRDIKNDPCSFWILRVGSDHWSELYII